MSIYSSEFLTSLVLGVFTGEVIIHVTRANNWYFPWIAFGVVPVLIFIAYGLQVPKSIIVWMVSAFMIHIQSWTPAADFLFRITHRNNNN